MPECWRRLGTLPPGRARHQLQKISCLSAVLFYFHIHTFVIMNSHYRLLREKKKIKIIGIKFGHKKLRTNQSQINQSTKSFSANKKDIQLGIPLRNKFLGNGDIWELKQVARHRNLILHEINTSNIIFQGRGGIHYPL